MVSKVVKRSGLVEDFDSEKLVNWAEWANVVGCDWASVLKDAFLKLSDVCTTKDLEDALIKSCLDREDEPHTVMAGRIYMGSVYKKCYGSIDNIPTLPEFYKEMVSLGYWADMGYEEEELLEYDNLLDHDKDLELTYPQAKQIVGKYSVKNRATGQLLETPQFSYIRMALGSSYSDPKEVRAVDVPNFYKQFSGAVNCTTPDWTNLGTNNKGTASCCLYDSGDSIDSLAAGDLISFKMTAASAGLGDSIVTRSPGDPIRGGAVKHNGKMPYLRLRQENTRANMQGARAGAVTTSINCLDPEIFDLLNARNPKTVASKKIASIDYSFAHNELFVQKAAKDEDWMLISYYYAKDLYEAFGDEDTVKFEDLFNKYFNDETIPKKIVKARKILEVHLTNEQETGRQYETYNTWINRHTPLKERIHHSNLCVAPETKILTKHGNIPIKQLEDCYVDVWNGETWSKVLPRKTGTGQTLIKVTTSFGNVLECTEYHKWYIYLENDNSIVEKRTHELLKGDKLIKFDLPTTVDGTAMVEPSPQEYNEIVSVVNEGRVDDTYCFYEKKRGMGMFNGILTGQCQEIMQHTRPYDNVLDLYKNEETSGEISVCTLAATVPDKVNLAVGSDGKFTEETLVRYEESCYYALKKIDNSIENMEYPFPNLGYTAKKRRYAGVGITGLAYEMALKGEKFDTASGKRYLHMIAELHMFSLIKASIRLSKERGVCEWIDRTKWVDGWLPIDTYNKNIDKYVDSTLNLPWEELRSEIVENGGHRFSLLCAFMPTESSSIASSRPNSIYPCRELVLIKGDGTDAKIFIATEAERLKDSYQRAWDIAPKDMVNVYGIFQKFCDQGISADKWIKRTNNDKATPRFSMKDMMDTWFHAKHVGVKSFYYTNTQNSGDRGDGKEYIKQAEGGCTGGSCEV